MKKHKRSIAKQLYLWLAILLLLGNSVLGIMTYNRSQASLFEQIQSNVKNIAQCAAASVSADLLQGIQAGDEETEAYAQIIDELSLFRDNADIEYIYTLRKVGNQEFEFVVDSDPEEPAAIGEECEYTEAMDSAFTQKVTTADDEPFTDEWGSHVSAYSPVMLGNEVVGAVGIDISANWIDEQMLALRNLVIITCIITYILSLLVLSFIMSKLTKSIKKLSNKVQELASGSGDLTKEIDINTKDEMGEIAENMNEFIRQIRMLVKDVAQSTKEILQAGEELGIIVNDNTKTMTHMNAQIDDISQSMEKSEASSREMSESLAESATSISEFSNHVAMICEIVSQANENAQKTSVMAKENRQSAIDSIHLLKERMEEANRDTQQIMKVKEIAEEIGKIAGQTRMLSLNAQIEAARAGTMGAGFAVVATQVGKLSDEIDRAVTEINEINNQVQDAVVTLSDVISETLEFVSEDVAKDYDSFAMLGQEYGETTETIHSKMLEIGGQSTQISQTIVGINENVQSITQMVSTMVVNANDLADSNDSIAESFKKLQSASDRNSEHSEKLNVKVNRYIY